MNYKIDNIQLDTSIQCRSSIDTGVVNEYAEAMRGGDKFPEVVLFGDKGKAWIGDGWHRILAAKQTGATEISAILSTGGRVAALKCALSANAFHGHRRSNADKRRCVEVALSEFSKLSSRAIAKMCGVSSTFADSVRPEVQTVCTCPRTGQDGKRYSAARQEQPGHEEDPEEEATHIPKSGPPCFGMQFARIAIMKLEEIRTNDTERQQAFDTVKGWIANAESKA